MKTIGLLGGMSWESTADYYRRINEAMNARRGGLHSARVVLVSVEFEEIQQLAHEGRWDAIGQRLAEYGRQVQDGGAHCLVLCTNTMHKVAPTITAGLTIPLLHVADVTADAVAQAGCRRPALLGTRFTMEDRFYRDQLAVRRRLDVLIPGEADRTEMHRIIFQELCRGKFRPAARKFYRESIARLVATGADSVILGCTEISLLLKPADSPVPVFDTTALHAQAAVDWALAGNGIRPIARTE